MKRGKTTIADIARKSGYSKTAVSFAFNAPSRISKEACDTILQVARELDYIPDPMARNFVSGKHMSLGFLLPQKIESSLNNPYTIGVIRGIAAVCEQNGYNLTMIPPLHSSLTEAVRNATVDGLITMGHALSAQVYEILIKRGLPVVTIDSAVVDGVTSVNVDDEKAAETAAEHAIAMGHRNFAIITLPDPDYTSSPETKTSSTAIKRLRGYRNVLEKNGIPFSSVRILTAEATYEAGRKAGKELFADAGATTCILAMADIIALGIIKTAQEMGIRIPEDFSIVGFDDIKEISSMFIELTTVSQSAEEKGKTAANALFELIEGKVSENRTYSIPYSFVDRKTLMRNIK